MATKYDTNPLDPDFPEKARVAAEQMGTQTLPNGGAETRQFAPPPLSDEEQTRILNNTRMAGFSEQYNNQYQTVGFANMHQSLSRKVEKIGLPENVMTALPYIPWFIGMVAGVLILFLVPKSEAKVRFHAAQGLAAHVAILIVTSILGMVGNITNVAEIGNVAFQIATTVMLCIFAFKAWKGKPIHIESIEDLTNWLEDKISPSLVNKS
ncbi:MAG: hypothetical protein QM785_06070 [Pyrinomonadaceae bacterium]